jgi:uncharacterized protein YecE (DUF72 family)
MEHMSMPSLFDPPPSKLALRLNELRERNIWIGTSSWKYEGWLGQIYTAERYLTRGRFSKKKFEETCLEEYAETFPIVCGDFSFYQFPSDDYWRKLFSSSPNSLRFAFKVPEDITVKVFPTHARYGRRAGQVNENFLNAELFQRLFLEPLAPYGDRAALFIFEFGTFSKKSFEDAAQFIEALDGFLAALPEGRRYSVEIRNPEYLDQPYFDCLRSRGVAHAFNAWSRMPPLETQLEIPGIFTADFTVVRALLRNGRKYERAVEAFAPYKETQDPNPEARQAMRTLIARAEASKQGTYIFVNNRLEGNAPSTIEAIVD